jgi:hypothetical protein
LLCGFKHIEKKSQRRLHMSDGKSIFYWAVHAALLIAPLPSFAADPISVLFVGNSYTFGRVDPVLTYNAANVRDLTRPQGALNGGRDPALAFTTGAPFTNLAGTNSYPAGTTISGVTQTSYSPHFGSSTSAGSWGGVPGIFKQLTVEAGLNYDVSLSTRNAATLRGHFLNTANSNWDLQGNLRTQSWNKVVLQEQSDEALTARTVGGVSLGSNFLSFRAYADKIENYIHNGTAQSFQERDLGIGSTSTVTRNIVANPNANAAAQVYLQQAWARPNLINAPGATTINPATGNATYSGAPATSFFSSIEEMTTDLRNNYAAAAQYAAADGTGGFAGVVGVADAFLRAITSGVATRNMYASDALSDGLIDLWFNDGTHASTAGSYLSALTLFGSLTGLDPIMFGASEIAARDLGLSATDAVALQRVASAQFRASVPIPPSAALIIIGGLGVLLMKKKKIQTSL